MTATEFRYSLFGLEIDSGLQLPELFEGGGAKAADVRIEVEALPTLGGHGPGVHAVDGGALLVIGGVARYFVAEGRRIVVEPDEGASERNVRLFLLGSAFGLLIHQRGLLPLHANAIEIDGKAVAFMGESGAGKSTLAAWFHDRGHRLVADDVCVVAFGREGAPLVQPGLPRLRLWREELLASNRDPGQFQPSYGTTADFDKFDVPIETSAAARSSLPLAGVFCLAVGPCLRIARLNPTEAAEAVFSHTYRGAYSSIVNSQREHWQAVVRLVKSTPVFQLERTKARPSLNSETSAIKDAVDELLLAGR